MRPFEAVICAATGHINVHETGAVEATGHKVLACESENGKALPEGVREVRQIVVSFDADQLAEYGFLSDAIAQGTDVSADLDALYAQLDGRIGEIRNQLHSGKSFADVEIDVCETVELAVDAIMEAIK